MTSAVVGLAMESHGLRRGNELMLIQKIEIECTTLKINVRERERLSLRFGREMENPD